MGCVRSSQIINVKNSNINNEPSENQNNNNSNSNVKDITNENDIQEDNIKKKEVEIKKKKSNLKDKNKKTVKNNNIIIIDSDNNIKNNNNENKNINNNNGGNLFKNSNSQFNSSILKNNLFDFYIIEETIPINKNNLLYKIKSKENPTKYYTLKKIPKDLISEKNDEKKILSELEILKSLKHKNIIQVIDCFIDEKYFNIITEFCEFGTFKNLLTQNKKFSENQTKNLIKQLLNAVLYLNSQNFIHTDIKPSNILINKISIRNKEEFYDIKLLDFGSSYYYSLDDDNNYKECLPYYVSPELIEKKYNSNCDVWSCGVIMFQMLFGYLPFRGNDISEIIYNIENTEIIYDHNISNNALNLLNNMLNKDENKRFDPETCLKHEWFIENSLNEENEMNSKKHSSSFESTIIKIKQNSIIKNQINNSNYNNDDNDNNIDINLNNNNNNNFDINEDVNNNENIEIKKDDLNINNIKTFNKSYNYNSLILKKQNKLKSSEIIEKSNKFQSDYLSYPKLSFNEKNEIELISISLKFIHHYIQEVYHPEREREKLYNLFINKNNNNEKIEFEKVFECFNIYSGNLKFNLQNYNFENLHKKFLKLHSIDNKINFVQFSNFLIDEKENLINELLYNKYDELIYTSKNAIKKIFLFENFKIKYKKYLDKLITLFDDDQLKLNYLYEDFKNLLKKCVDLVKKENNNINKKINKKLKTSIEKKNIIESKLNEEKKIDNNFLNYSSQYENNIDPFNELETIIKVKKKNQSGKKLNNLIV